MAPQHTPENKIGKFSILGPGASARESSYFYFESKPLIVLVVLFLFEIKQVEPVSHPLPITPVDRLRGLSIDVFMK